MTGSRYRSRYATKEWKMVCGCIAMGRAADHQCKRKAELLAPRKCKRAPCTVVFTPTQPTHEFCSKPCNGKHSHRNGSARANARQAARKGLSAEEREALDMEPKARAVEAVRQRAESYLPVMGEALYEATMQCMRSGT